jgi:GMP synthase-like glutamine amidotransferase
MHMGFQPFMAVGWQFHEEMKTKFGQERDKEFASHVCAEHPKARKDHQ